MIVRLIRIVEPDGTYRYLNKARCWTRSLNDAADFPKKEADAIVVELRARNRFLDHEEQLEPEILEI